MRHLLTFLFILTLLAQQTASAKWYDPTSWFEDEEDAARQQKQEEQDRRTLQKLEEQRMDAPVAAEDTKEMGAVLETSRGNVTIKLYPQKAPKTVANFRKLASEGFYNQPNMIFHRVVPGFVVQTGDPSGTGFGGSDETIPLEVDNELSHDSAGVVAMARGPNPNSATSQFYVTLAPQKQLDGKYAIFGRVLTGLEVLEQIEKGDKLYGVKLTDVSDIRPEAQVEEKSKFRRMLGL